MLMGLLFAGLMGAGTAEAPILAELERLDQSLVRAEALLQQNQAARSQVQEELATHQASLATARVRQKKVLAEYRDRIRALARLPNSARYALMGGARSLTDYLESARMLRLVAQHDKTMRARLQLENESLAQLTAESRQRRDRLDALIAEARKERDTLAASRQARADLLRGVQRQAQRSAVAQEKRGAQKKLQAMMVALRPPQGPPSPRPAPALPATPSKQWVAKLSPQGVRGRFSQNRGRLPWPAGGALRTTFGQRVELAFGTVTSHNGWDIGAAAGSRAQAVAPGQVVYAGWLRGYGQLVIIDHGDNYHSVTAHLAAVDVQVGDTLRTGQGVGTVGDTGSLRGTVLYFELRHKGVPVDPRIWLRS